MRSLLALQVETTNRCNAKCLFCPHHKFAEFGTMSQELYEKIVDEASRLPALEVFTPMLTGEPFCDPQFVERLKLARSKLPNVMLEVYTNGHLLTKDLIDQLCQVKEMRFSVSLNAITPETRKRMTGLDDYVKVADMMLYMEHVGMPYRATMVGYPEIRQEEIRAFVKAGGLAIQYQSWCGEQYPYDRRRWTSCPRAMNYMTVRWTGQVCLCCFDPFGKVDFGDLNKETIEDIWQSSRRREYQSLHRQGRGAECELCNMCTEG